MELQKVINLLKVLDGAEVMNILIHSGLSNLEAAKLIVSALEDPGPGKIQMEKIKLLWNEGRDRGPQEFTTWEAFNNLLEAIGVENGDMGYSKTKFELVWTDGEIYAGRLDVSEGDDTNLGQHILRYLDNCVAPQTAQDYKDKYEIVI